MYSEINKTWLKEIEDDTNKWKYIPCSWNGRINTVKMTILSKAIHRFNSILIKIPMAIFHRTRTNDLKIFMATQKTLKSQNNLEKEEQSWRNDTT